MARCAAIKADGARCAGTILDGNGLCGPHSGAQRRTSKVPDPATIAVRIVRTMDALDRGEVDRGDAAVMFQGANSLLRASEVSRKWRELDELIPRLEALERQVEARPSPWRVGR